MPPAMLQLPLHLRLRHVVFYYLLWVFLVVEVAWYYLPTVPTEKPVRVPTRPAPEPAPTRSTALVFGVFTDLHAASAPESINKDSGRRRYHREGVARLDAAVDHWRRRDVQFLVDLGDLLDAASGRLGTLEEDLISVDLVLRRVEKPTFKILGNHDLYNFNFSTWLRILKSSRSMAPQTRFFRRFITPRPGVRILLLNSFAISVLGGEVLEKGANATEYLETKGRRDSEELSPTDLEYRWKPYNGAFGDEQLWWMESQLATARRKREKVIIFSHIAVHPESSAFTAWDRDKALHSLTQFSDVIVAFVAGHAHTGGFFRDEILKLTFLTLDSMTEAAHDDAAYHTFELHPDRLTVQRGQEEPLLIWRMKEGGSEGEVKSEKRQGSENEEMRRS